MVRRECLLYQQQQGHVQQQGSQARNLTAVLAGVADCAYALLKSGHLQECTACISAVLDVLGMAAASVLLRQLVCGKCATDPSDAQAYAAQLVRAVYRGWLAVAQPPTSKQGHVTSRLQALVVQPLQQRLQEQQLAERHQEPLRATAGVAAGEHAGQAAEGIWGLHVQGVAAANAGDTAALMQCLEQLLDVHPERRGSDSTGLLEVAVGICKQSWPALSGLCDALLAAWWEGKRGAAGRVSREVMEAVVAGVQAWQQLEQQAAPVGANRRRLG
jgi:hypothetical protein